MSPQVQTQVKTQLSVNFKECKGWFDLSISAIDEGDFLGYFLLLCSNLSEADRQEIITMLKDIKMTSESMDAYSTYDSDFWYMWQTIRGDGAGEEPFAPKRVAELHAAGLRGAVQDFAKEKAKSVDKDLHSEYVMPVAEYMEKYRPSHPTIEKLTNKVAALVAGAKGRDNWRDERKAGEGGGRGGGGSGGGGGGGRGNGGRGGKANAVNEPKADAQPLPPIVPTANTTWEPK